MDLLCPLDILVVGKLVAKTIDIFIDEPSNDVRFLGRCGIMEVKDLFGSVYFVYFLYFILLYFIET